jgi:hypothetical protein
MWRGIFLPTSEHPFSTLADMAGETRDAGEPARCTDVPATSRGQATVFDRRPKSVEPEDFDAWARAQLVALRAACEEHHGVAIAPYLEHLIGLGAGAEAVVRSFMAEFKGALGMHLTDGALQHAAANLALVYAGGRIAIDAGILPWKPKRLLRAIIACFRDALAEVGQQTTPSERAQKTLREKLTQTEYYWRARKDSNLRPPDS